MLLRRVIYRWQVVAAVVLPLWLVVGTAIFGSSAGDTLSLLLFAPLLALGMLAVAGLIFARKSVRSSKAVSWADAGVLLLWHASIVATGLRLPGVSWYGVLIVVAGLAAFWLAVWQLVTETRRRVSGVMDAFTQAAAGAAGSAEHRSPSVDASGPVIVVEEHRP
ncbi:MFS transporter [Microbacterium sp. STN6]|uniref:MFS transporter n=1 Tax=Microbacterium sp. STN6 TaxID=2995588 RepID=UPI00226087B3|nr:MFS transporter [Microbacterium sp. STN6]MCX7522119.1 MFS transporter [Microbacterium sp. STN6]